MLSSVFDHSRGNVLAAGLYTRAFAAAALGAAEHAFPVHSPSLVSDEAPLARPPQLSDVPSATGARRQVNGPGLVTAVVVLHWGLAVQRQGRRRTR